MNVALYLWCASIFWFSSEIIGDWYLLIRTKALIKNTRKTRWVFVACLFYNLVKIGQMFVFLKYIPFPKGYHKQETPDGKYYVLSMAEHKYNKWVNVALQQLCSLVYDILVFLALKNNIFNKIKNVKINDSGRSFLHNFKQISEYRIFISIIVTLVGIPFLFSFCFKIIYLKNYADAKDFPDEGARISYLGENVNDMYIDPIRVCVLNFNYVFMYIDQILLRFFVEKNNSSKKSSSNQSGTLTNNSFKLSNNPSIFTNNSNNTVFIPASNSYNNNYTINRNYDEYDERNPMNFDRFNNNTMNNTYKYNNKNSINYKNNSNTNTTTSNNNNNNNNNIGH
eukprot:jgi/Orpsp1_1/1185643/evm.model.c7180000094709.1